MTMPQTKTFIDDECWDELIDLTDGAAAVCFQCGVCTSVCPWGLVKDKTYSVRSFIRHAQLGLQDWDEGLWNCTTCGQCESYCPRGVNITNVFRGLRYLAWKRNHPHVGFPNLLWSVHWNNNPWDQPPSKRSNWATNLNLPEFDPQKHDVLLYIGCTCSYDNRAQKLPRDLVKILLYTGISFGVLGNDEPCSGEEVLSVGHKSYFKEISQQAVNVFRSRGVSQIVTIDPHSYDAFTNYYPEIQDIHIQHYTQFLAQQIKEDVLRINSGIRKQPIKITFHDPCYLSRHNAEIEAPRTVLNAIPGIELVEMDSFGTDTFCCGGGGGRMWIDTIAGERFSDRRIIEAKSTGAEILGTSCPYCISCLDESVKAKEIQNLVVMDVVEIVAQALNDRLEDRRHG